MFWTDYLIVLAMNLCRMLTIETTIIIDVGELSNRAGGETNTDSGSIFNYYSDVSDDESNCVNPEDAHCTINTG